MPIVIRKCFFLNGPDYIHPQQIIIDYYVGQIWNSKQKKNWHWLLRLYPGCSQFQRPPWRTRLSVRPQLCPAGTSWTWCTVSVRPCKRELPRVHRVEAWQNKPGRRNQLRRWLDESINMQLDSKLDSKHHFLTFYFLNSLLSSAAHVWTRKRQSECLCCEHVSALVLTAEESRFLLLFFISIFNLHIRAVIVLKPSSHSDVQMLDGDKQKKGEALIDLFATET